MNSNDKNPNVSTAIPKAKPKMERLSPGVYRNSAGSLVRSTNGQPSSQAPGQHFLPGAVPGNGVTNALNPAPQGLDGNLRRLVDLMGGGNGAGARPIPKMPGNDIDPGFAVNLSDVPPELRRVLEGAITGATPQTPRSGGSVADLLRRR